MKKMAMSSSSAMVTMTFPSVLFYITISAAIIPFTDAITGSTANRRATRYMAPSRPWQSNDVAQGLRFSKCFWRLHHQNRYQNGYGFLSFLCRTLLGHYHLYTLRLH